MNKTELYALLKTRGQGLQEGMDLLLGLSRAELAEMASELGIDVFKDESNKTIRHNIVMFGFFLPRQLKALRKMSGKEA